MFRCTQPSENFWRPAELWIAVSSEAHGGRLLVAFAGPRHLVGPAQRDSRGSSAQLESSGGDERPCGVTASAAGRLVLTGA